MSETNTMLVINDNLSLHKEHKWTEFDISDPYQQTPVRDAALPGGGIQLRTHTQYSSQAREAEKAEDTAP